MKNSKKKIQVKSLILVSTLILCGCGVPRHNVTLSGNYVSAPAYNLMMEQRGLSYYCDADTCDTAPRLLYGQGAIYPRRALRRRQTGSVLISFDINRDGSTGNFEVESSTSSEFSSSVIKALRLWKFEPAKLKGVPVKVRVTELFPFKIL